MPELGGESLDEIEILLYTIEVNGLHRQCLMRELGRLRDSIRDATPKATRAHHSHRTDEQ